MPSWVYYLLPMYPVCLLLASILLFCSVLFLATIVSFLGRRCFYTRRQQHKTKITCEWMEMFSNSICDFTFHFHSPRARFSFVFFFILRFWQKTQWIEWKERITNASERTSERNRKCKHTQARTCGQHVKIQIFPSFYYSHFFRARFSF